MTCAGREVAEFEELLEHRPGFAAERAAALAFLDDELQLLRRVGLLVTCSCRRMPTSRRHASARSR